MEFIPKTISKQEFSDGDFRFRVLAPDHGHIITSGFLVMDVCHEFSFPDNQTLPFSPASFGSFKASLHINF